MVSSEKAQKLALIADQVKACQKCPLYKTATHGVPGDGNPDSEIVFIGEAPGFHEDQQGLPFVGRAGKLLDFLLHQIRLDRKDVWIGNIIKHRPPDNRDPTEEEISACKPYLTQQLEILRPTLVVTLGRFSMNYFLPNAKISQSHGQITKAGWYNMYPVYHPAAALRNSQMKNALIIDFLKIPDLLNELRQSPSPSSNVHPTTTDNSSENADPAQFGLF